MAAPCDNRKDALSGAIAGGWCARIGAHVEHATSAERDLRLARPNAALADQAALLITDQRGKRRRTRQYAGLTEHRRRVDQSGQHGCRHVQLLACRCRPPGGIWSQKAGDRRVGVVGDVHAAVAEHPRHPRVDRAEAQIALASRVVRVEQPRDFRGRLVRCQLQPMIGLGADAVEDRSQVLPAKPRANRLTGRAIPHDGAGTLRSDADGQHRPALGECGIRNLQYGRGHPDRVELDETGERSRRRERPVVQRCDLTVGPHNGGPQARGSDIHDKHTHWRPPSPR